MVGGILEVDLVSTDAEASDNDQVLGLLQNPLGKLGLGANTDDVNVTMFTTGQRSPCTWYGGIANRIFSMSWSSGSEDLRNSTW